MNLWHLLCVAFACGLKGLAVWKGHPEAVDNIAAILIAGAFGNATVNARTSNSGRSTDAARPATTVSAPTSPLG